MIEATRMMTSPRADRRLVILDGLSRMAATVVMATLLFSVIAISFPPGISRSTLPPALPSANTAPIELERSWIWSQPSADFDSMYGSRSRD
ncbi:MAG: hypothetical protein ACJZ7Z_06550 [Myxococcota bacterium]